METQEVLNEAIAWPKNSAIDAEDRQEIQDLLDNQNHEELTERFYKDLEFGTGGIRAILGNGKNRINKYMIRKATQAVINGIKEVPKSNYKLAISFDSRKYVKKVKKCQKLAIFGCENSALFIAQAFGGSR